MFFQYIFKVLKLENAAVVICGHKFVTLLYLVNVLHQFVLHGTGNLYYFEHNENPRKSVCMSSSVSALSHFIVEDILVTFLLDICCLEFSECGYFLSGLCKILVSVSISCINHAPLYVPSRPNNFLTLLKLLNGTLYIVVRLMMCSIV